MVGKHSCPWHSPALLPGPLIHKWVTAHTQTVRCCARSMRVAQKINFGWVAQCSDWIQAHKWSAALACLCSLRVTGVGFQQFSPSVMGQDLWRRQALAERGAENNSLLPPAQYFHNLLMASQRRDKMVTMLCLQSLRFFQQGRRSGWDRINFFFLLGNWFVLLLRSPVQHCRRDAAGRETSKRCALGLVQYMAPIKCPSEGSGACNQSSLMAGDSVWNIGMTGWDGRWGPARACTEPGQSLSIRHLSQQHPFISCRVPDGRRNEVCCCLCNPGAKTKIKSATV